MPKPNDNAPRNPRPGRSAWMWGLIILFVLAFLVVQGPGDQARKGREISYSDFLDQVEKNRVASVVIEKDSGIVVKK